MQQMKMPYINQMELLKKSLFQSPKLESINFSVGSLQIFFANGWMARARS